MGLLANLPVGLAPGLGLNAYVRDIHKRLEWDVDASWIVCLFCRRVPRLWNDYLWGSAGGCIHGRVRITEHPVLISPADNREDGSF
jgi:hypothetical protein